ncbi:MAG: acyltransferase [Gammaproteobacteria bacterium]|nr:MAG: acyltransferase [Gammaproteobacteria bacterium]
MSGNSHSHCNSSVTLKFKLCGSSGYPCASPATPVPIGSPKTYARADGFRDTRGFWGRATRECHGNGALSAFFFTLSSFLITTLLLRESSVCGALDVTAFYLRRVLRILPLYFGFLLAATTLARSLVPDENLPLKYVVAFALLCGNWACVLWGYPHSVASPLWSVSIEEQF